MCGIAGYFTFHEKQKSTLPIYKMNQAQEHRGPDDSGFCSIDLSRDALRLIPNRSMKLEHPVDGFMGFSRLSILDLSQNGHQPMLNYDKTCALTFNGEIYNAFDFKENLERDGYHFISNTDTEVILALYLKYGIIETAKKLNGMFAFSIFDMRKKKLYLVRDRFGIKPLYYVFSKNQILYASEMKCFTVLDDFEPILNRNAFMECAVFGYSYRTTLLKGVEDLKPGSVLCYDFLTKDCSLQTYFDINQYTHPEKSSIKKKQAEKELYNKLKKSVERQMISDVQLGCQLSGGVDSSLTSYFTANHKKAKLDGVSVIFDKEQYGNISEERYMDFVSKKLGIAVHKAELTEDYFIGNLVKLIWHLDTVPKFYNEMGIMLLAEEAKKHATVLLSGEGSDELLCGYRWMKNFKLTAKEKGNNTIFNRVCRKVFRYGSDFKGRKVTYDNYVIFAADALPKDICQKLIIDYREDEICHMRREALSVLTGSSLDKQIKYEMLVRLPALLNRQDKTTMSASIENRVPFLDNEVVDFAFQLPEKCFVKYSLLWPFSQGKYLLKEVCSNIFGRKFAYRKKSGFPVPILDYLKKATFKEFFYASVIPGISRHNLLNTEYIKKLYKNIDELTFWEGHALFMAISLEIWIQIFIEKTDMTCLMFQMT